MCSSVNRNIPLLIMGAVLIPLGLLMPILAHFIAPTNYTLASFGTLFSNFWVGMPAIVTGILGIVAGTNRKNKGPMIGLMVMAIITFILGLAMIALFIFFMVITGCYQKDSSCFNTGDKRPVNFRFMAVVVGVGSAATILALVSLILSCRYVCSCCGAGATITTVQPSDTEGPRNTIAMEENLLQPEGSVEIPKQAEEDAGTSTQF